MSENTVITGVGIDVLIPREKLEKLTPNSKGKGSESREIVIKQCRVELTRVPFINKMAVKEYYSYSIFSAFNNLAGPLLRRFSETDGEKEGNDFDEFAFEIKHLDRLCEEISKLHSIQVIHDIETDKLVCLLSQLGYIVLDGIDLSPNHSSGCSAEEEERALTATLISMYILTSASSQKNIYLDDLIDSLIHFTKQLLYRMTLKMYCKTNDRKANKRLQESMEKKRYCKLLRIVPLILDLINVNMINLSKISVFNISNVAVLIFFNKNMKSIERAAFKIIAHVCNNYHEQRNVFIDLLFQFLSEVELPDKCFKTMIKIGHVSVCVQKISITILEIMQNVMNVGDTPGNDSLYQKLDVSEAIGLYFLDIFMNMDFSKQNIGNHKKLFVYCIDDFIKLSVSPMWPAAEGLVIMLGKLLVARFVDSKTDTLLRLASLEYFMQTVVKISSHLSLAQKHVDYVIQISNEVDCNTLEEDGLMLPDSLVTLFRIYKLILIYLFNFTSTVSSAAKLYFIAKWIRDVRNHKQVTNEEITLPTGKFHSNKTIVEKVFKNLSGAKTNIQKTQSSIDEKKVLYERKAKSFFKMCMSESNTFSSTTFEVKNVELAIRYLVSLKILNKYFDIYFKYILMALTDNSSSIRIKVLKCLPIIMENRPDSFEKLEFGKVIINRLYDKMHLVREAAILVLGKYALKDQDIFLSYIDTILNKLLDSSLCVRKRTLRVLKDACVKWPNLPHISELWLKIISFSNQDDSEKKDLEEFFHSVLFVPVPDDDEALASILLLSKATAFVDLILISHETGLDILQDIIAAIFKEKETQETEREGKIKACQQLIDSLFQDIFLKESADLNMNGGDFYPNSRIVNCIKSLELFAKICPRLLTKHFTTLRPILHLNSCHPIDWKLINLVLSIYSLVFPSVDHSKVDLVSSIEEDCVQLLNHQDLQIVSSSLACLKSVIKISHNVETIRKTIKTYFDHIMLFKQLHMKDQSDSILKKYSILAQRTLFLCGQIHMFFDVREFTNHLPYTLIADTFESYMYFINNGAQSLKSWSLVGLGFFCVRYCEYMTNSHLTEFYKRILSPDYSYIDIKLKTLKNIELFLEENDIQKFQCNLEDQFKEQNLKQISDDRSETSSAIVQMYLNNILNLYININESVRKAVAKVIEKIVDQGLVHPVILVPHLICMSADEVHTITRIGRKYLHIIERKYPNFISMKAITGLALSFKLQAGIQNCSASIVRGYRSVPHNAHYALGDAVYSLLQTTKQRRRAFLLSIFNYFTKVDETDLRLLLYFADNLATFRYQILDEPLFVVYHVEKILSCEGTTVLSTYRNILNVQHSMNFGTDTLASDNDITKHFGSDNETDSDDQDEETSLKQVLDGEISVLRQMFKPMMKFILLILLKQYLMKQYGISDVKLTEYSPADSSNRTDKPVTRQSTTVFDPEAVITCLTNYPSLELETNIPKDVIVHKYNYFKRLMAQYNPKKNIENQTYSSKIVSDCSKSGEVEAERTSDSPSGRNDEEHEHRDTIKSLKRRKSISLKKSVTKKKKSVDNDPDYNCRSKD